MFIGRCLTRGQLRGARGSCWPLNAAEAACAVEPGTEVQQQRALGKQHQLQEWVLVKLCSLRSLRRRGPHH